VSQPEKIEKQGTDRYGKIGGTDQSRIHDMTA
jgi:hypothetical protein